jgi:hypothetical protein
MDYLLRSTTESDLDDALIAAGLAEEVTDIDGEVTVLPVTGVTLDRIGPIPPTYDIEGQQVKAGDPRFHTNIRVTFELTEEQVSWLPTFTPEPSIPYRVFA